MMEIDQVPPPMPIADIPLPEEQPVPEKPAEVPEETSKDQTTLVENEAEAFALEPLDITGTISIDLLHCFQMNNGHTMFAMLCQRF